VDAATAARPPRRKPASPACDVIVPDRDLPGVHGDRVCRTPARGCAHILMLAAAVGPLATP